MKKNHEIPIGGIGVVNGYKVMAKEYKLENSCEIVALAVMPAIIMLAL